MHALQALCADEKDGLPLSAHQQMWQMPSERTADIRVTCLQVIRDMWVWTRRLGRYHVSIEDAGDMIGASTSFARLWWFRALSTTGFVICNRQQRAEIIDNAAYFPKQAQAMAVRCGRKPPKIASDLADRATMRARQIDAVEMDREQANIRRALRQWRGTDSHETPEPIADAKPFKSLGRPSVSVEQHQRNLAACEVQNAAVRARIEARFAQQTSPALGERKSV
jgi:hypothetical protein